MKSWSNACSHEQLSQNIALIMKTTGVIHLSIQEICIEHLLYVQIPENATVRKCHGNGFMKLLVFKCYKNTQGHSHGKKISNPRAGSNCRFNQSQPLPVQCLLCTCLGFFWRWPQVWESLYLSTNQPVCWAAPPPRKPKEKLPCSSSAGFYPRWPSIHVPGTPFSFWVSSFMPKMRVLHFEASLGTQTLESLMGYGRGQQRVLVKGCLGWR